MVDTPRTQTDLLTNLFQDGQAANSITAQDMRDLIVSMTGRAGWADYNDAATTTTPITVTGGAGWVYLTNDELGAFTNKQWIAPDITDVWDASTNQFDWTDLGLLDDVFIRLDLSVTTLAVNADVETALEVAIGGSTYDIPFTFSSFKSASTYPINRLNSIYMGDTNTLNNPAKFKIRSDKNCTAIVNGWWCKVEKY